MSSHPKSKQELLHKIENALDAVDFGSIEIYVTDKKVTQITVRNIEKTSIDITEHEDQVQEQKEPKLFTIQARLRRTE